jgi:hypothetical protein
MIGNDKDTSLQITDFIIAIKSFIIQAPVSAGRSYYNCKSSKVQSHVT